MGRFVLILTAVIVVAMAVIYRLFNTTVIYAEKWQKKAELFLSQEKSVVPERGKILADDRSVLAANMTYYMPRIDLLADGIKKDSLYKYLPALGDSLAKMFPNRSADEWQNYIRKAYDNRKTIKHARSYPLGGIVTYRQFLRMKTFPFLKKGRSHGFYYDTDDKRCNPYGRMAARSIGKVGPVDSLEYKIGTSGLERAFNDILAGEPGKAVKTQLTSSIDYVEHIPAKKGYDIMTTINVGLQEIVEQELYKVCVETEAKWGTAILMEVETGKIKAISNLEYFEKYGVYAEGVNHAVIGYEPGSVMKPISMMVALEDGSVRDINEVIETKSPFRYPAAHPITDAHPRSSMPVWGVIAYSSNIGMAKITLRKYEKDPGMYRQRLEDMGFFDPLNLGIAGEQKPRIAKVENNSEGRIDLSRMAFGYTTHIPPICTLIMYNAIANDGRYIRPRLVERFIRDGEPDSIVPMTYIREQVCSPENAAKLRYMLQQVVSDPHGTGKSLKNNYVTLAGKTGTCYVLNGKNYTRTKRLSFCGFYPYEKPKYSCIVVMEGANRGAGGSSGLVFKNIALKLFSLGLLDNNSDYYADAIKEESKNVNKGAVLYATIDGTDERKELIDVLRLKGYKHFGMPKQEPKDSVPDVVGLGAREAVAVLESAGLKVRLKGAGYVVAQSVNAGSPLVKGELVNLTLKL